MIRKIRHSYVARVIYPKLKNRYALTLIGFLVWLVFFDRNDLLSQHSMKGKLNKLNKEKAYYLSEIAKNRKDLNDLVSNSKTLEKFARERYLMKKDGEDIFIFVEEQVAPGKEVD